LPEVAPADGVVAPVVLESLELPHPASAKAAAAAAGSTRAIDRAAEVGARIVRTIHAGHGTTAQFPLAPPLGRATVALIRPGPGVRGRLRRIGSPLMHAREARMRPAPRKRPAALLAT
jgi:hypothetical protein